MERRQTKMGCIAVHSDRNTWFIRHEFEFIAPFWLCPRFFTLPISPCDVLFQTCILFPSRECDMHNPQTRTMDDSASSILHRICLFSFELSFYLLNKVNSFRVRSGVGSEYEAMVKWDAESFWWTELEPNKILGLNTWEQTCCCASRSIWAIWKITTTIMKEKWSPLC